LPRRPGRRRDPQSGRAVRRARQDHRHHHPLRGGIDEVKRFGSLDVRARVCNTRPVTEQPKTTAFVEVEEVLLEGGTKRVFTGWMLAESPGLNAVEHPVYDVWLTGCRNPEAPDLALDSLETLLESLE
jgi:hypothetical protein